MIPQDIIDKILHATNIVDLISGYVTVKKAGVNFKSVCPFHDDTDPSMVISPAKNIWRCFSCGEGGNAITFVQKHESISFPEAVKIVGDKCNISLPTKSLSDEELATIKYREALYISLDAAQQHFADRLSDRQANKYIAQRNISDNILQKYKAGYAPESFQLLADTLTQKGYNTKTLLDAGLITQKDNKIYDRFINRITFPYLDMSGRVIGFTGRELPKPDGKEFAKYMNSPETELFNKSNTLFGLYQAKQSIGVKNKAFLVEGQFDVMGMAAAGFDNVVCGSGTAFTANQAKLLRRFTDTVSLIYDGDAAGMKASIRNMDILLSHGFNVYAAILPEGKDPDTYVREEGKAKFDKWLKKNELNFITFMWKAHIEELNDPIKKTAIIKAIAKSIANMPSHIARETHIQDLANRFHADAALLSGLVKKSFPDAIKKSKPKPIKNGFYGLDDAREMLQQNKKELTLTYSQAIFANDWGVHPTVFVTGTPTASDIQELRSVSYAISCKDKIEVADDLTEPVSLELLKALHLSGFSVNIEEVVKEIDDNDYEGSQSTERVEVFSFTEYYIRSYSKFKNESEYYKTESVKRCAEIIARADNFTRNLNMTSYAKMLGITKTALEAIIKPLIDEFAAKQNFKNDNISEDNDYYDFDGVNLPGYLEEDPEIKRMYEKHNFFPLINKKTKHKVAYYFKTKSGYTRVGNFYIEPLLHIYDKDSDNNKRVIELTQLNTPHPVYMEWISKEMITMQTFRQRLWEEGDINFSNGNQFFLDAINESWAGKFKRCTQLHTYGYYDEGFFAFSNAIFHMVDKDWQIQEVSDLGLVEHNGLNYYIPAFSKIYASEMDRDKRSEDRYIMYRQPEKQITFEHWAQLMMEVYKENDNGIWAILYAFMCAFRSDIFEVDRIFTALFFIGPTGSGKSEVAYSIRSIFQPHAAPLFNLNQGTDAAMFTIMEKYRNIPLIFDEYNDMQISDVKFQGLKAAVYDGEGKQKRKDAGTKEIDTSVINAPLVICGQESPQRDDNSLANRSIIRSVPKKDDRTEHEDNIFRELKGYEKSGLQNILLDFLKEKKTVRNNYTRIQREVYKDLKDNVRGSITNSDGLSRVLNTYSMFLATCKLIQDHTDFKLPFTYKEFSEIANSELIKQVESISTSNRMFTFFSTIGYLIDNGSIIEGRDFKIEQPGKLTLQKQGRVTYEKTLEPADINVLHLSFENVFREYSRTVGQKEGISKQSLMTYLQSHEAWIGSCRATRFAWKEAIESSDPYKRIQVDANETIADPTMRRIMVEKKKNTSSVVLNYDILKELLDIDYQRTDETDAPLTYEEAQEKVNGEMPFAPVASEEEKEF